MNIIVWIVVGLIAGFLSKVIMPGDAEKPGDWLGTMLLGIVGAVLGGWLWGALNLGGAVTGFDLGSILIATIGACITLGILRLLRR